MRLSRFSSSHSGSLHLSLFVLVCASMLKGWVVVLALPWLHVRRLYLPVSRISISFCNHTSPRTLILSINAHTSHLCARVQVCVHV
jgi:hypothetical protein